MHLRKSLRRVLRPKLLAPLAILTSACALGSGAPRDTSPTPLADFKGLFTGDSIGNDGRKVQITFDIQQAGNDFTGTYRCAAGNANCRNQMTKGWVRGTIDARSFRVSLQDTSWCLYTLGTFYLNDGEGEYTCYLDSAIVDQGGFAIRRVAPN